MNSGSTNSELSWKLVTLDFDNRKSPNIIRALRMLKKSQYRDSCSKQGFHVRGWAYCLDPLEVRRELGDDPERIRFDEKVVARPKGILWDVKVVNGVRMEAGKWEKFTGELNG